MLNCPNPYIKKNFSEAYRGSDKFGNSENNRTSEPKQDAQAEVEAGVGTATVTRELASRINETAAPGDRVSGEALRGKVRQKEYDRNLSGHNDQINNPTPKPEPKQNAQVEVEQKKKALVALKNTKALPNKDKAFMQT